VKRIAIAALVACGTAPPPPHASVQIIVDATLDSEALERSVTIPIEVGVANIGSVHSVTDNGRVVVTVDVPPAEVLAARQQIMMRLEGVELPEGLHAELGPVTTRDGVLARYIVRGPGDPRTLQDWTIRARLLQVPGVADVSTCGTPAPQLQLFVAPSQLDAVRTAFAHAHHDEPRGGDGFVLRSTITLADVAPIVATIPGATLVHANEPRTCFAADPSGNDLVVGTVWLRTGSDRATVTAALDVAFAMLRASGVELDTVNDPFEATVAATVSDLAHATTTPLTLVETGRPDGGFLDGLPGELHIHAPDRATAQRAADQLAGALHGTSWTGTTTIAKISGPELGTLAQLADRVPNALQRSTGRVPAITFTIDRAAAARADLSIATIDDAIAASQAGLPITEVWDADRRIDLVARTTGPLLDVVKRSVGDGPTMILRESFARYVLVRTHGSVPKLDLPPGYTMQ
jgi:Cu/Ag efflux pump CusA